MFRHHPNERRPLASLIGSESFLVEGSEPSGNNDLKLLSMAPSSIPNCSDARYLCCCQGDSPHIRLLHLLHQIHAVFAGDADLIRFPRLGRWRRPRPRAWFPKCSDCVCSTPNGRYPVESFALSVLSRDRLHGCFASVGNFGRSVGRGGADLALDSVLAWQMLYPKQFSKHMDSFR